MATYQIDIPGKGTFEVSSQSDLTDAQAYKYALSQSGGSPDIPGQKAVAPQKAASGMANYWGPAEAILSLGSGAVGGVAAPVAGVLRTITSGKYGTQEGIQAGQDTARSVMDAMTYRPRTELGQNMVGAVGDALSASKLAGIGPSEAIPLATLSGPAIQQAKSGLMSIPVPRVGRQQPEMIGVGAAETSVPAMRIERAQSLPVPINLTKGQATRSFEQQQFEREAAKNPTIGEPLRQRFAEQNRQIPQNLEFFADQTGAEAGNIRATGQIVSDAIVEKAKSLKGRINAAYESARTAGETQAPIDVAPLVSYLESNKPQSINAGVISSALSQVQDLSKKTGGALTVNDLEEVRKAVGVAGGKDATNAHYAREIRNLIDGLTENAGGPEYKYARRLRAQYAKEFENTGIIDRLMSTKPGTADRAIAFEDVFDHAVLRGSLDDTRALRRTLQTGGPNGEQAWREIQGQTINHIKEEITKNAQRDINGAPIVSPAQFNKVVNLLDKDGKLDFIFGKQGAQKIRDLREISLDSMTSPPGSINHSNTAAVVLAAMDSILSGSVGLPLPVGTAIKYGVGKIKDARLEKQVVNALGPIAPRK